MNVFATDAGLLGVSCAPLSGGFAREVADGSAAHDQRGGDRLRVAPETLRFWRWKGVGPASFRVGGQVVYRESVVTDRVDAQAPAAAEG